MITSKNVAVRSYEELKDYQVLYEEGNTKTTSKANEGSGLEVDGTRIDENEEYDTHLEYDEYITIDPLSTGNNNVQTTRAAGVNNCKSCFHHLLYYLYEFRLQIQKCYTKMFRCIRT